MATRPTPFNWRATRSCLVIGAALVWLHGCASLPPNAGRAASFALTDTAATALGRAIQPGVAAHPGQSGFYLLPGGLDAFAARAALASRADSSIDAQYYLLHNDLAGRLFLHALLQAANRGVRVRLLLDDMALSDRKDMDAAALDAHANIQIRVFNPFARKTARWLQLVTRFGDVTRRMHNKAFIVDNLATIVGGRNIGNEYFDADPTLAFGDLDVLAVGPVVDAVSSAFDLYWNSAWSYPVSTLLGNKSGHDRLSTAGRSLDAFAARQRDSAYLRALRENPVVDLIRGWRFDFDWGEGRVLYDRPAKIAARRDQESLHLSRQLKLFTNEIEGELIIFSPYFVPGREGVASLVALRKRGVRVRIVTNSLGSTDVVAVHAGYARYRKYLLRAGVELYEIDRKLSRAERREKKGLEGSSKASLHAKSFIIDREQVFIGSLNLDPRSIVENTEIGILLESASIAARMADWFEQISRQAAFRLALITNRYGEEQLRWYRDKDGVTQVFTTEPNAGFWLRFGAGLLRLLPIESQL